MNNIITENLRGFEIRFETKAGVFSEKGLDNGTRLLVDNLKIFDNTLITDLGSGTGIVGIVCAKLNPHGHVHLLDDVDIWVLLGYVDYNLNFYKWEKSN